MRVALLVPAAGILGAALWAAPGAVQSRAVVLGPAGRLVYTADREGNTIPDFSNCGYRGGGVRIPEAPVKATLRPAAGGGDDTARIQAAIDEVGKLRRGADGLRGAVLLARGRYRIEGALTLGASGVVLRGEGDGEDGTILVAAGTKARTLIALKGTAGAQETPGTRQKILDAYVPVGARTFRVAEASRLKPGDTIIVSRVGNAVWIHEIAMDRIPERPGHPGSTKQWGPFSLNFDRVVAAVQGDRVTIDAPIVCAIDTRWGGGEVWATTDPERVEQVGVERLRGVSEFDRSVKAKQGDKEYFADEKHATYLVSFGNAKNAWARNLTTLYFAHGPASMQSGSKWISVQDCTALDPVSVITGGRRYPYNIGGQLCLVQRCTSRGARHAFAVGSRICGPNVFLDGKSEDEHATSEPHHRWSVGGLFDNVHANIAFQDRGYMGTGHGWAGANYVAWNCEGSLVCQQPPTAQNWAIGQVGKKSPGAFTPRPEGWWESLGQHVEPRSLYLAQLEDRLGRAAVDAASQ